ncbi:hypothetical protein GGI01_001953 [Coemansia sp. RSA 376]|nr:hypothetical protein GGI01_001953 [Coemansia sp. RSA 376]
MRTAQQAAQRGARNVVAGRAVGAALLDGQVRQARQAAQHAHQPRSRQPRPGVVEAVRHQALQPRAGERQGLRVDVVDGRQSQHAQRPPAVRPHRRQPPVVLQRHRPARAVGRVVGCAPHVPHRQRRQPGQHGRPEREHAVSSHQHMLEPQRGQRAQARRRAQCLDARVFDVKRAQPRLRGVQGRKKLGRDVRPAHRQQPQLPRHAPHSRRRPPLARQQSRPVLVEPVRRDCQPRHPCGDAAQQRHHLRHRRRLVSQVKVADARRVPLHSCGNANVVRPVRAEPVDRHCCERGPRQRQCCLKLGTHAAASTVPPAVVCVGRPKHQPPHMVPMVLPDRCQPCAIAAMHPPAAGHHHTQALPQRCCAPRPASLPEC